MDKETLKIIIEAIKASRLETNIVYCDDDCKLRDWAVDADEIVKYLEEKVNESDSFA